LQTNKRAGIILILCSSADYKYFLQLNSALSHAGLTDQIRVWAYPNDFPGVEPTGRAEPNFAVPTAHATVTDFWLTASSKKRHKKSCRQYENSKGRYCTASEGAAAGCCH
jgi:hypothetical protein